MSKKFLVPIVLPADPAAAMEAATKQYVDGMAGSPALDARYVNVTGDVMSGQLALPAVVGNYGANAALQINSGWMPFVDGCNYFNANAHYFRSLDSGAMWASIQANQIRVEEATGTAKTAHLFVGNGWKFTQDFYSDGTRNLVLRNEITGLRTAYFDDSVSLFNSGTIYLDANQTRFRRKSDELTIVSIDGLANQTNFDTKVRVGRTGDVSLAGDAHDVQIGPTAYANLAFDWASIQSRYGAAANTLHLNPLGGLVRMPQALLRSGQSSAVAVPQLTFDWNGGGYGHEIRTVHNGGSTAYNAFDFFLWKMGDPIAGPASNNVLTLGGVDITARVRVNINQQAGGQDYLLNLTALGAATTYFAHDGEGWTNWIARNAAGIRFNLASDPGQNGGRFVAMYMYDAGSTNIMPTQIWTRANVEFRVPVLLAGDPTVALHAATKQYVDGLAGQAALDTRYVNITGDAMSGYLSAPSMGTGQLSGTGTNGALLIGSSWMPFTDGGFYMDGAYFAWRQVGTGATWMWMDSDSVRPQIPVKITPGNVAIPLTVQQGTGASEVNIKMLGDGFHGFIGQKTDSNYKYILQSDPSLDAGRNLQVIMFQAANANQQTVVQWRHSAIQHFAPTYTYDVIEIQGARPTDVGLRILEKTTTGHAIIDMRGGGWVNIDVRQGNMANRYSLVSDPSVDGGGNAGLYVYEQATGTGRQAQQWRYGSSTFGVPVLLAADPTSALQAATKQYVDGVVVVSATDPIATSPNVELWYDTSV